MNKSFRDTIQLDGILRQSPWKDTIFLLEGGGFSAGLYPEKDMDLQGNTGQWESGEVILSEEPAHCQSLFSLSTLYPSLL